MANSMLRTIEVSIHHYVILELKTIHWSNESSWNLKCHWADVACTLFSVWHAFKALDALLIQTSSLSLSLVQFHFCYVVFFWHMAAVYTILYINYIYNCSSVMQMGGVFCFNCHFCFHKTNKTALHPICIVLYTCIVFYMHIKKWIRDYIIESH